MKIKKIVPGSQVLVTEDNHLYRKFQKNGKVFFKELTPCCQNEYMAFYKVSLTGRQEHMFRGFLVTKEGKIAAEFLDHYFMLPFLLGKELLVIEHFSLGRFIFRLGHSYLWQWQEEQQHSVKVSTELPNVEVQDDEVEVISIASCKDILHYKYKGKDYYKGWRKATEGSNGCFEEVKPEIITEILDKLSYGNTLENLGIKAEELEKAEKTAAALEKLYQIFGMARVCEEESAEIVLGHFPSEKLKQFLQEEFENCPAEINLKQSMWKFAEQLV